MSSSISVAVRVRPFSEKERLLVNSQYDAGPTLFSADGNASTSTGPVYSTPQPARGGAGNLRKVLKVLDDRILVFDPPETNAVASFQRQILPMQGKKTKDIRFCFDRVFDEGCGQEEVYDGSAKELVAHVMDGFHSTVFAYGATGCGKTHTISGSPTQPGIVFLIMKDLFARITAKSDEVDFSLTVSYLEIYNETIRDLLAPESGVLQLRDSQDGMATPANLSTKEPSCAQDVVEWITLGNTNRTVNFTEANATSSRSHAVLRVTVTQKPKAGGLTDTSTSACLSVIDLAGSERASVTKNRGERLTEGANINRSLLALGNCINALCDPRKRGHVPYRDSKLTRLLKQSLGGNCKTVMIVCVSPSSAHYDETHNTLQYANRAKEIKTKAIRNVISVDRHVAQYCQQIMEQAQVIERLRRELDGKSTASTSADAAADERAVQGALRQVQPAWEAGRAKRAAAARAEAEKDVVDGVVRVLQQWQLSALAGLDADASSAGSAGLTAAMVKADCQGLLANLLSTSSTFRADASQADSAMDGFVRAVLAARTSLTRDRPSAIPLFSAELKALDARTDSAAADARAHGVRAGFATQAQAARRLLDARARVSAALDSAMDSLDDRARSLARLAQSIDKANAEAFAGFAGEPAAGSFAAGVKRDQGARSPFAAAGLDAPSQAGKVPRSALSGVGSAPTGLYAPYAPSPMRAKRSPGILPQRPPSPVGAAAKKGKGVQWADDVGEDLEDVKYNSPVPSAASSSSASTPSSGLDGFPSIAVTSPKPLSSQSWTVPSTFSTTSDATKAAEVMASKARAHRPTAQRLPVLPSVSESPAPFSFLSDSGGDTSMAPPSPFPARSPFHDLANTSSAGRNEASFSMAPGASGLVAPLVAAKPLASSAPASSSAAAPPPTPTFRARRASHIGPLRSDKATRRTSLVGRGRPSLCTAPAPAAGDTSLSSAAPSRRPVRIPGTGGQLSVPGAAALHPPPSARKSPRKLSRPSLAPSSRRLSTLPSAVGAPGAAAALAGMQPTAPARFSFGQKSAARIAARKEARLSGGSGNNSGSGASLLAGGLAAVKKESPAGASAPNPWR
ncbi:tubulin-dependent ATPase kip3 [Rhodotorula kratochvilovae]